MQLPLITVIIPVYWVERYLPKCIESILAQTYRNLEIFLVDDGSPDSSGKICDKYAKIDNRIHVIHQKNQGVSAARNAGLEQARGEYIAFVDGDDWCESDYLECLFSNLLQNQADLAICGYIQEDPAGKLIKKTKGSKKLLNRSQALQDILLYSGFQGFVWNKLCRRSMIEQYRLRFDKSIGICEDLLFYFQVIQHSSTILYDPTPKYHYIQHKSSALQAKFNVDVFNQTWLDEIKAIDRLNALIPTEETSLRRQLTAHKVRVCATLIRLMAKENANPSLISNLRKFIKKNLNVLFTEKIGIPVGTKIGVIFTLLFPRFAFYLWKKKNSENAQT